MVSTSSSSSSVFQPTVHTGSTFNDTSKASERQSIIYEEINNSEKEPGIFTNQNCLDQTHINDSNDEMEETDCIANILDNAGHTGRVPQFESMGLTPKTNDFANNMNITCGGPPHTANVESKLSSQNNTLYSKNNIELVLEPTKSVNSQPSTDDTFSNLFAVAGIKKDTTSAAISCNDVESIISKTEGDMEMTCKLPAMANSALVESSSAITCLSPVICGMEMECQLPCNDALNRLSLIHI